MKDIFQFADDLGPEKVIHIYDPSVNLKAMLAIDNTDLGPGLGGIRIAPDVNTEEVVRLARAMTFKNAAAGLPYGGAKSAILGNPHLNLPHKEKLIRAFSRAIRNLTEYIPGPDMGLDEQCMAWVYNEIGRGIGLPATMGGLPLDEIGATGFGLSIAVEVASRFCHLKLKGARLVIQGFGSVGSHTASFLAAKGVTLVAASDSQGLVYEPQGLDVEQLIAWKQQGKSLIDFPQGTKLDRDYAVYIDSDIWIPAARPDFVNLDNVSCLKTKLVVQGANIPFTLEAEKICHARGILIVPDFIANAGGVICGAVEYQGGTKKDAFQLIQEKIRHNTKLVLEHVQQTGVLPRQAALELAHQRLAIARTKNITNEPSHATIS